MEPKSSPESFPQVPHSAELPTPVSPEYRPNQTPERAEPSPERAKEGAPQAPAGTSVTLPTPVIVPTTPADDNGVTSSTSSNPATAADEDLIEKEWVDKAKKIISETKDDPHKREQEVGKLQADYLKKRYGRELGNS
jgi:hypothetical protein